jgi:hypothetical protein
MRIVICLACTTDRSTLFDWKEKVLVKTEKKKLVEMMYEKCSGIYTGWWKRDENEAFQINEGAASGYD